MRTSILIVIVSLGLAACEEPVARNTGAYMLLDTSGTYSAELAKAETKNSTSDDEESRCTASSEPCTISL